jgi:hypothetical protein
MQRGAFEEVGESAQGPAQRRGAGDDVVVAGKDLRVVDDADREAGEEAAQPADGVGADVGSQPVAQRRRQPVDQRHVAKVIAPAPEYTVRLEGIAPVGDEDDDAPARPGHAHHLGHAGPVVGDVLQHLVGEDDVEGSVGEREVLADGLDHASGPLPRLQHPLALDLDAKDVRGLAQEGSGVHPHAAPHVEHAPARERHPAAHHPQSPFLPRPPDVGGFTAVSTFIGGCEFFCHGSLMQTRGTRRQGDQETQRQGDTET